MVPHIRRSFVPKVFNTDFEQLKQLSSIHFALAITVIQSIIKEREERRGKSKCN